MNDPLIVTEWRKGRKSWEIGGHVAKAPEVDGDETRRLHHRRVCFSGCGEPPSFPRGAGCGFPNQVESPFRDGCAHGSRPSTIDHRPSTIDHRPSTIDHRPSTIDHRLFYARSPESVGATCQRCASETSDGGSGTDDGDAHTPDPCVHHIRNWSESTSRFDLNRSKGSKKKWNRTLCFLCDLLFNVCCSNREVICGHVLRDETPADCCVAHPPCPARIARCFSRIALVSRLQN